MAEMTENLVRMRLMPGLGNRTIWRLLSRFGNSDAVLGASLDRLVTESGVNRDKARLVLESVRIDPRHEMDKAAEAGVDIIPYDDPGYPKPLLHTYDPPAVLYVKGQLLPEDQLAIAMVGTRRASPYGRELARSIASALARGGYTIVSGLALGIDSESHQGALDGRGRTVGVLGCGFDHMYPPQNRDLALIMTRNGAVVTEFPMATSPSRETFPARNRIIAGMGLALVVIEAPLRSGSLITARLANEFGRTVFVVPGRVNEVRSEGSNRLIQDGAVIITSVDDIFRELNPSLPPSMPLPRPAPKASRSARAPAQRKRPPEKLPPPPREEEAGFREAEPDESVRRVRRLPPVQVERRTPPGLDEKQKQVYAQVTEQWRSIDDITAASGLPSGAVASTLVLLRIKRLVEQGPGQVYRLYGAEGD